MKIKIPTETSSLPDGNMQMNCNNIIVLLLTPFNQKISSKLYFGINHLILCLSFPHSVERESGVFSQGTGFRLIHSRNDRFQDIFWSMTSIPRRSAAG